MTSSPGQAAACARYEQQRTPLFSLGTVLITPGALDMLEALQLAPLPFVLRHVAGEWGDLCQEDKEANAASSDEWRVELSPTSALRYGDAGVVLEPQARELQANAPVVTALRLRQRSWAQGLGLWLEIQGEGRLSAVHQAAIAERFEAAGHQAPQLRYVRADSAHQANWLATWHWDEAVWVPRDMPVADVKRWALETALKATEHWLLMCGMVALAGKPLAPGTGPVTFDAKREATNEKKF